MNHKEPILIAEEVMHAMLIEELAVSYGGERARFQLVLDDENENFTAPTPLWKICIYQSELPSLFINLTSEVDPPAEQIISLPLLNDPTANLDTEDLKSIIDEVSEKNSNNSKLDSSVMTRYGGNIGATDFVEGIFYYRQALLLEQALKKSGAIALRDDFFVTTAIHGPLDDVDEKLWNYCRENLSTPIDELLSTLHVELSGITTEKDEEVIQCVDYLGNIRESVKKSKLLSLKTMKEKTFYEWEYSFIDVLGRAETHYEVLAFLVDEVLLSEERLHHRDWYKCAEGLLDEMGDYFLFGASMYGMEVEEFCDYMLDDETTAREIFIEKDFALEQLFLRLLSDERSYHRNPEEWVKLVEHYGDLHKKQAPPESGNPVSVLLEQIDFITDDERAHLQ